MKNELKEIAKECLQKVKAKDKDILAVDIGANDGTFLSFYPKNIYKIGIEPISKFAKECKQNANVVINDFFHFESYKKKLKNKKADIITAISCFYDIDNPNKFLSDIKRILNEEGIFVIQQNYLVGMLEQNAFDNIVHEHLEYYSLLSLENLLKRHGLEVFDVVKNDINGGCFRTYISFKNKRRINSSVVHLRNYEKGLEFNKKKIYQEFGKRVRNTKKELHDFIKSLIKKNKKIYIYGASTRGNTLIQYCKLDNKLIAAAVERNPEKWGKRIASMNIPIISEEQARREKPDYMLVLPWFFKEEFLQREKKYLRNGGHLIFPLPKLGVI